MAAGAIPRRRLRAPPRDRHGYVVIDGALPLALVDGLFLHVSQLSDEALSRAGVCREDDYQLNRFVRHDETCWLDPEDPAARPFLDWMERLRLGINRRLFLGLFDYEAHFARYAPGALHRRHRDAFAGGGTNRVLSTVLYLNPGLAALVPPPRANLTRFHGFLGPLSPPL